MAGLHDVLANVALIVGGTQPDSANKPYFYSGQQKGDSSQITGINGCYLGPPVTVDCDVPFAVVLMDSGSDGSDFRGGSNLYQGTLLKQDLVKLQICVGLTQQQYQMDTLTSFRDLIPTAFAAKMTLNSTANVLDAFPQDYRTGHVTYAGTDYQTLEFRLRVRRDISGQTYTA